MSGARDLTADIDIDIAGLLSEVWKKRWLVAALTVLTGVALMILLSNVAPRYQSSARILIEKRESVFTRRADGDYTAAAAEFDEQAIGSQVQILSSDNVALKVISALNLTESPEFNKVARPSLLGKALVILGLKNTSASVTPEQRMLKAFRQRLTVYAADKSRVVVVEFWSHDPVLAQRIADAIAEEYLAINKQAKLETNIEATEWLGPEINDLRERVRAAEAKVAEFRANSDILVGNNNALLSTQQLSEVSSELSRLRAERSAAEAKAASVRAALEEGGSLDVIPEVISSPLIQRLRERQVSLQAEISDLSTTLLSNHPKIKALRSQLADFDAQIRDAARNILTSLENNVDLVHQQEAVLVREVDRLKAEAARVGEAEVELRALEREAASQRELLEAYLTRYREAASRQSREYIPVDARIISNAVRPSEAYFPKVIPLTIAGMITMLVLSVVGILAWALMSGKAFKPVGLVDEDMIPLRADIPDVEAAGLPASALNLDADDRYPDEEVADLDPEGADLDEAWQAPDEERLQIAGEAWSGPDEEGLETASESVDEEGMAPADLPETTPPSMAPDDDIPLAAPGDIANDPEVFAFRHAADAIANLGRASIAVVSPAGDPGSVIGWLLARRLAAAGHSVAVIDLTGTAVTSREMLGAEQSAGLRELLAGAARFREVIQRDRISDVHILPSGGAGEEPGGMAIDRLASIAEAMADSYDYLVFDCGYTGPEGLKLVAGDDTVVAVSCEGASAGEAVATASQFQRAGFGDTIMIRLEPSERDAAPAGAAA